MLDLAQACLGPSIGAALSHGARLLLLSLVPAVVACGGGGGATEVPIDRNAPSPAPMTGAATLGASIRMAAANPHRDARFGIVVSVASDGASLRIGADGERSPGLGIDAPMIVDESPLASGYGAVYLFERALAGGWSPLAFVKPSTRAFGFGSALAASDDGRVLAVGAPGTSRPSGRDAFGVMQAGNASGRVFVFERADAGNWRESTSFESAHTRNLDRFGGALALSGDGTNLVVGAPGRRHRLVTSRDDLREERLASGAFHVFARAADGSWRETQFERAPYPEAFDHFGSVLGLSADASVLAVGAYGDGANATGVGGDERLTDGEAQGAGVVYLYERDKDGRYRRVANLKPLARPALAAFGAALAISADGRRLAVGGSYPSYSAAWVPGTIGVDPQQLGLAPKGIVEIFERRAAARPRLGLPADARLIAEAL